MGPALCSEQDRSLLTPAKTLLLWDSKQFLTGNAATYTCHRGGKSLVLLGSCELWLQDLSAWELLVC